MFSFSVFSLVSRNFQCTIIYQIYQQSRVGFFGGGLISFWSSSFSFQGFIFGFQYSYHIAGGSQFKTMKKKLICLTKRVPCLYCKLYGPSHGKKRGSVTYCMDRENEVSKIFILKLIRHARKETIGS